MTGQQPGEVVTARCRSAIAALVLGMLLTSACSDDPARPAPAAPADEGAAAGRVAVPEEVALLVPVDLPSGWEACATPDDRFVAEGLSTLDDRALSARVELFICGPGDQLMRIGTADHAAAPDDAPADPTLRMDRDARDDRRTLAVDVLRAPPVGELSITTVVLDAPLDVPLEVQSAVLRSVPLVALAPEVLPIAPGPPSMPTLAELRERLDAPMSRLTGVRFLFGAGGTEDDGRPVSTSSMLVDLRDDEASPVVLRVEERPDDERWWASPEAITGATRHDVGGLTILVSPPGRGPVPSARTRCGRWRVTLSGVDESTAADATLWSEAPADLAVELLADVLDAVGCGRTS